MVPPETRAGAYSVPYRDPPAKEGARPSILHAFLATNEGVELSKYVNVIPFTCGYRRQVGRLGDRQNPQLTDRVRASTARKPSVEA